MMNNTQENKHIVDLLFVLGLFLVFTISALFLILIGSGVYKSTVDKMDRNFDTRTSFAYLTEKLRQNDCYNSITIDRFDGQEALIMTQDYNGVSYSTYIYLYDGYLKELFTTTDNQLTAASGQDILPAAAFHIVQQGQTLFELNLQTTDGADYRFYVSTHCSNS